MAEANPTTYPSQADPSPLTTQQILREIANLEKLVITRIEGLESAQGQFQESITRVPTEVQKAVEAVRELMNERFSTYGAMLEGADRVSQERLVGLHKQFAERDIRTDQAQRDAKTAIDAALQSAKEAVGKSEMATVKQIDQLGDLLRTVTNGITGQIGDLKDRVTSIESRTQGLSAAATEARQVKDSNSTNLGLIYAVVFGLISAAGLIIGLIMRSKGV
jgi:hypothetical protein